MRFRDDRRAVALQVGAILLLGFLVIGLALYQATVVPDQNERVEFDHNQQVQDSLQDVRNGILRTASAERTSPTTVPLGTRYPTRVVAVNPPPSSGRLATEPGGEVTLVGATAINDETADYWNGTNRSYATKRLSYRPDYSLYQSAPRTTYADTVLYNGFDGGTRAVTDQRLLEGNLLYLVALNGSYSRSGTGAVSVSPTPVSTSDRTVAVNGSDMAIEVTTDLSEDEWERLLSDQYERNGGRIDSNAGGVTVYPGNETLVVDLVPNRTYRLRMAKVGVGTGVTDTDEQYLTVVDGADSVTAGGTRRIVLEVRDGYNNPVSGVTVGASVNRSDAAIRPNNGTSDGQGQIVYEYVAPDSLSSARDDSINFSFERPVDRPDFSGAEPESVRINVTVVSLGGGNNNNNNNEQIIDTFDDRNLDEYEGDTAKFDAGNGQLRSEGQGEIYSPSTGGLDNYPDRGDTIQFEYENQQGNPGSFRFGMDDSGDGGYELELNADGTVRLFDRDQTGERDSDQSDALNSGETYIVEIGWGSGNNKNRIEANVYERTASGERAQNPEVSLSINRPTNRDDGTAIGFSAQGAGNVFDEVVLV
jgi:hypothetical protein